MPLVSEHSLERAVFTWRIKQSPKTTDFAFCVCWYIVKPLDTTVHSFIHSYSFNVQVDITQLQTDREARKEDRIYIYICSSYSN